MPKDKSSAYSNMDSMKMHTSNLQAPKSVFSQGFENSTLNVVKRDDKVRNKEASKLRSQKHMGRYE